MADVKWIKVVTDIFDDEKILMIEQMPGGDSILVIWFKLLTLAGKQNNGGMFVMCNRPYTEEMFAAVLRRPLETVKLALRTFEDLGMIEIVNGCTTIPNWSKHQNLEAIEAMSSENRLKLERKREYNRLRMQEKRLESKVDSCDETTSEQHQNNIEQHPNNIQTTSEQQLFSEKTTSNNTRRLELELDRELELDKERDVDIESYVDIKTDVEVKRDVDRSYAISGEPSCDDSPPAPECPPVFSLELNDGTKYGVTQEDIDKYSELYPAVDVPQEFRKMIGWIDANPKNRKTRSGIKRFINSWLTKEQDRRHPGVSPPRSPTQTSPPKTEWRQTGNPFL